VKSIALVQAHAVNWDGTMDVSLRPMEGREAILWTLKAMAKVPGIEGVVLATTEDPDDDVYELLAEKAGVRLYRGSPFNVLERLQGAMDAVGAEAAVLAMGMHPFTDIDLAGKLLQMLLSDDLDLVQPPPNFPAPFSSLAFQRTTLTTLSRKLDAMEADGADVRGLRARPFVYIQDHPEAFRVKLVTDLPTYPEEELQRRRALAKQLYVEDYSVPDFKKGYAPASFFQVRYEFAFNLLPKPCSVLDIACGPGYGTYLAAQECGEAIGGDLDAALIQQNQERWADVKGLSFQHADALKLPFPGDRFDAVLSMETIEHVPDIQQYVSEMRRVLRPGGVFICSTPQSMEPFSRTPFTPSHMRELTAKDMRTYLSEFFEVEGLYGVLNGIIREQGEEGTSMIAVCRAG
jgi:SAM-dependent methyltransferase/spore coat polysaccharide biosynthesis protein SpsF (cytidylyltransferase family)